MTQIVIRGENLGKRYDIGERERYLALRDLLARALRAPARMFSRTGQQTNHRRKQIWALRNASFEVREGEVVGLIGRNGAGKTTLLKILARVTRPTEGHAEIRGRMGSLLEVGTGFHPELTGRENVFLSGAILGMSKREIVRKFDEMVAFAEVEKFIDTPLKHYSSGMQMRLAFAVAAHLEPEILLVDEVLAVGDMAFQKKCLGKMSEVARGGRTIVFVSHQMNQIRRLCERTIWIDGGEIRMEGATQQVVSAYEESISSPQQTMPEVPSARKDVELLGWEIVEPRGTQWNSVATGAGAVLLCAKVAVKCPIRHGHVSAVIYDNKEMLLCGWAFNNVELEPGRHALSLKFQALPLRPGPYTLHLQIWNDDQKSHFWPLTPCILMQGTPVTHFMDEWAGVLNIPCTLESRPVDR